MKMINSVHKAFSFSLIFVAVLSVGLVGYFWVSQAYKQFNEDIKKQEHSLIAARKTFIKSEVDRVVSHIKYQRDKTETELKENIRQRVYEAVSIAQNLYEANKSAMGKEQIIQLIKEALRPIRFNQKRGYFFVYTMEGDNVLLPFSPKLEGKNLWDLKDSKGLYTIRRAVKIVREKGEGFFRWHWYKPGNKDTMSVKIGFVKHFKPLNWFIGTGEYVEDFEKKIQKETLKWINTIRYGKDGYIFVYDFKAITLAHYKQKNIGVDRWNYQDANGVSVVRDLIRISQKKDGGYLSYVSTIRPTTGRPAPKIGYARAVMDWQWMVGTGVYIENLESLVAENRLALKKEVKGRILKSIGILMVSLIFIFLLTRLLSTKMVNNIKVFSLFFQRAAKESAKIEDEKVNFTEFKDLAVSANQMVEERNRAQISLAALQDELARSKKMEALGLLAGGVAHDLNNVLSGMVSYPDLILADLDPKSPLNKYILTIKSSGQKAADIVQDLLTLARRGVAQVEVLNINRIVKEYLASPEHEKIMGYHPKIRIIAEFDTDLLNIKGSPVHLKKTIMNLISNAVEAMPHGGEINIVLENRYVDSVIKGYETINEGDYVVLTVKDSGIGIEPEDLERIFEPFYTKKKMGRSGTGLGMAVVWGTVQDHNGYIDVTSDLGKGTVFELYFRATRKEVTADEEIQDLNDCFGSGQTILVVDDVKEQRELAQAILTRLNYRVETVSGGEKAVEYVKEHEVDLVLLDMIMDPGMDGFLTYKKIIEIRPGQKAVIVSGFAETKWVKDAIDLGVGRYVKKPYTVNKIGMAVKAELDRKT